MWCVTWQERFHRAALELIAITTSSSGGSGSRAEHRLAAAAATDAAAPALLKIERAAIAAATPISYQPQELLLLMYEHLKASGLHSAAASLAKEAGLAGSRPGGHSAVAAAAVAGGQQQQQQQQQPAAAAGGLAGCVSPLFQGGMNAAQLTIAALSGATPAAAGEAPTGALARNAAAGAAGGSGGPGDPAMDRQASGNSAGAMSSRDRRRTLSLAPGLLLSHIAGAKGSSPSDTEQQAQQQQAQQQTQQQALQQAQQQAQQQQAGRAPLRPTPPPGSAASSRLQQQTGSAAAGAAAAQAGALAMSPPQPLSGVKRRAGAVGTAAGAEAPAGKRQALGDAPGAGAAGSAAGAGCAGASEASVGRTHAAAPLGAAAAAAAASQPSPAAPVAGPPAANGLGPPQLRVSPPPVLAATPGSSRRGAGSSGGSSSSRAKLAASDAEFIQALQQQQLQQQQQQEVFHTQAPPATPQVPAPGAEGLSQSGGAGGRGGAGVGGALARSPFGGAPVGCAALFGTPSPAGGWHGFGSLDAAGAAAATPSLASPGGPAVGAASPLAAAAQQMAVAAAASAQSAPPGVNPLLTNLPARQQGKPGGGLLVRRLSGGVDAPHRMTPIAEAAPEPKPLPLHVQVAAREVMTGPPVNSRLSAIVTSYLRQQHRAACLASAQPVSVVPPVSLLKPYTLPVASRPQQAPANVALRRVRQEAWGGYGGRGGASATRRFVWSRFRLTHSVRDDGPLLTSCCFLRGFEQLVAGTAGGELRLHDAYSGENVELIDAHTAPVNLLQASSWQGGAPGDQLLLSSSRSEVLLWRADSFDTGPLLSLPGLARGRFNPSATQVVGVAVGGSPRQARVFDAATGEVVATLDEAAAAAAAAGGGAGGAGGAAGAGAGAGSGAGTAGELVRGAASACFSPSGELVLWGATLWDPRVPAPLHTFDQLSAGGTGGCFHPGGAEIILNSEVWDLRSRKLLRSVPLLDGTSITFNSSGDVLCAWLRRPADDSMAALLQPKRRRHALATSFASLDARTYSEIASVQVERAVLDLCLDPTDAFLAAVAVDIGGGIEGSVASSVRLYEAGRQRTAPGDDGESGGGDDEDDEEEDSDVSDDDGDGEGGGGGGAGALAALLGSSGDGEDGGAGGAGGEGEALADEEEAEFELEEGASLEEELEDALQDAYEQALAAGVDPEDLEFSLSGDEDDDGDGGGGGGEDEEASLLLSALEGTSSEYETDDEAAGG